MHAEGCARCGLRVGLIGVVVNTALFAMKAFIGSRTGSRALTADALFSLLDVLSAFLVVISFRLARKRPDRNYPYGYGKVEFIAVAVVSLCIAAFAYELLERIIAELWHGERAKVDVRAALAAIIASIACYTISRYSECAARHLHSPLLHTHAEHNKFDAFSSLAVVVSIILSSVGLAMLDPIVALLEIVDVVFTSGSLLWRGVSGLLDAVEPRVANDVAAIARQVPGVLGVTAARARPSGSSFWVELAVEVKPKLRLCEVSSIRTQLRTEICGRMPNVANIMIDVAPAALDPAGISASKERTPWLSTS